MNPVDDPTIARVERFRSLARLFLSEPDAHELRVEFTRLLTLNVFPYASVYLDAEGCLNTETTARVQAAFDRAGFAPDPALPIGAPDHFGLELEFVAQLIDTGRQAQAEEFLSIEILPWAEIFLHAVERNAQADLFQNLARDARAWLMAQTIAVDWNLPAPRIVEDNLDAVVKMLITPSHSGFFLSKQDIAKIARALELPVAFGDRALMLSGLFRAAGEYGRIEDLIGTLEAETHAWIENFKADECAYPAVAGTAQVWVKRAECTLDQLREMKRIVQNAGEG